MYLTPRTGVTSSTTDEGCSCSLRLLGLTEGPAIAEGEGEGSLRLFGLTDGPANGAVTGEGVGESEGG